MTPSLSVIVPVRNAEETLAAVKAHGRRGAWIKADFGAKPDNAAIVAEVVGNAGLIVETGDLNGLTRARRCVPRSHESMPKAKGPLTWSVRWSMPTSVP